MVDPAFSVALHSLKNSFHSSPHNNTIPQQQIYDDIDHSDATAVLNAKKLPSESNERQKHDLSQISVPSAAESFKQILACRADDVWTKEAEVLAKILIDVWMCRLVDFCTLLKIGRAAFEGEKFAGKKRPVVVIAYMGQLHTQAVEDFFISKLGFKKGVCVGEVNWEEGDSRQLRLPEEFWDPSRIFE